MGSGEEFVEGNVGKRGGEGLGGKVFGSGCVWGEE